MTTANILSFGTLEQFQLEASGLEPVRVIAMERPRTGKEPAYSWLDYLLIITQKRTDGDIAACLLHIGRHPTIFRQDKPHHAKNLHRARQLATDYLTKLGFSVAPGGWNLQDVVDQAPLAGTSLWTFQNKKLVPADQAETPTEQEEDPCPNTFPSSIT